MRRRGEKKKDSGEGELTLNQIGVASGDQDTDGGFICDTLAPHQGHTVPELFHDGLFFFFFFNKRKRG